MGTLHLIRVPFSNLLLLSTFLPSISVWGEVSCTRVSRGPPGRHAQLSGGGGGRADLRRQQVQGLPLHVLLRARADFRIHRFSPIGLSPFAHSPTTFRLSDICLSGEDISLSDFCLSTNSRHLPIRTTKPGIFFVHSKPNSSSNFGLTEVNFLT